MFLNKRYEIMYQVVQDAGRELMKFFRKSDLRVTEKSANNPVSEADFAANNLIVAALRRHFPEDAILSEEILEDHGGVNHDRHTSHYVWIIDPLDGTNKFIQGIPEFCVSVGLLQAGTPILGFIYNPALEVYISGGRGLGVRSFEQPIDFTQRQIHSFDDVRYCISSTENKQNLFADLHGGLPSAIGSVAYKLALVARGDYDLILSRKPKQEWDIAAGAALFAERGFPLLNANFEAIPLNKPDTISYGLIGGDPRAIEAFRLLMKHPPNSGI